MKFFLQRLPAALLALVLVALAVPLGYYVGPAMFPALVNTQPAQEQEQTALGVQQAPPRVRMPTVVTALSPSAPVPAPAVLEKLLLPKLAVQGPGNFSGVVLDAESAEVLFDQASGEPRIPASNQKLLTAAAAVLTLGPTKRFETAVFSGTSPGVLILRGGGDVMLRAGASRPDAVTGHAGLLTLAEQTVKALPAADRKVPLRVVVDVSLFAGPVLNPNWAQADIAAGEIAAVYPLAVNSSWLQEGVTHGPRSADAALAAGQLFRDALDKAGRASGIHVSAVVERGTTAEDARKVAGVESAPVVEQAKHMLRTSDNYVAEVLARMTAEATGAVPSFDGGTAAVVSAVQRLGVPVEGLALVDASGMSLRNRMNAAQLAATVRALIQSEEPGLREVLAGLPVAALDGTLKERFADSPGAGVIRAKTGTLFAATSLSGYVVDRSGRLLVFAFIANGLDSNTEQARDAVDSAAAVLAGCGCR